jgi:DtxR family Mn-dependent transcriptional regulator
MARKSFTASIEDYLETIYLISLESEGVRVTALASRLKIKKASVSEALTRLSKRGLIKHKRYGVVTLTAKGKTMAEKIYKRHKIFCKFLEEVLGVDSKTAERDACLIEHAVSRQTLQKIENFMDRYLVEKGKAKP